MDRKLDQLPTAIRTAKIRTVKRQFRPFVMTQELIRTEIEEDLLELWIFEL